MNDQNQFVFLPLGGVGEIGMNLGMYGFGPTGKKSWIVVDFGLGFARETQPGVDLIFPDISFLESEKKNVLGIVLTHAHEDHYGGLVEPGRCAGVCHTVYGRDAGSKTCWRALGGEDTGHDHQSERALGAGTV